MGARLWEPRTVAAMNFVHPAHFWFTDEGAHAAIGVKAVRELDGEDFKLVYYSSGAEVQPTTTQLRVHLHGHCCLALKCQLFV